MTYEPSKLSQAGRVLGLWLELIIVGRKITSLYA